MSSLQSKIALVTGAGRGAGQAIALALGQQGAYVACLDINPDATEQTTARIVQAGGRAASYMADVSNKMALQTALYAVLEEHGRIDVLVSAVRVTPHSPALKMDEWEWDRVLDTNLKGAFLVAQTTARAMKETGGGVILNVIRPVSEASHVAARVAREGLIGLTAALADEWREFGVRVELLEATAEAEETGQRAIAKIKTQ